MTALVCSASRISHLFAFTLSEGPNRPSRGSQRGRWWESYTGLASCTASGSTWYIVAYRVLPVVNLHIPDRRNRADLAVKLFTATLHLVVSDPARVPLTCTNHRLDVPRGKSGCEYLGGGGNIWQRGEHEPARNLRLLARMRTSNRMSRGAFSMGL